MRDEYEIYKQQHKILLNSNYGVKMSLSGLYGSSRLTYVEFEKEQEEIKIKKIRENRNNIISEILKDG